MMQQKKFHISWQRVLLIVLLFCIISAIIYGIYLYQYIIESKTERFDEATEFVLQQTNMVQINDISYFQADEGYYVLEAIDKEEELFYIFLMNNKPFSTEQLFIIPFKEVMSSNELEQLFKNECNNCTLVRSTPAMIDQYPLWEFTYIDESNRYVIEYKYLENGKTFEKLRLTRKYKKD